MTELSSAERKFLRGLAHDRAAIVAIGKEGLTDAVAAALDKALADHELVKVRFVAEKEREGKRELAARIETRLACALAGLVGHVAIFYRRHPDEKKRKIRLPD